MSKLYIGVMSGTSLDGVDISLCRIGADTIEEIRSKAYPFPSELKEEILEAINTQVTLEQLGTLDHKLGLLYAQTLTSFLQKYALTSESICAIGLHGQTLWHAPESVNPFTMQLGDANLVVAATNIKVVADFRRGDIANGGQGAPFAPAFHRAIFKEKNCAVLNIGGMANITLLGENYLGYDTGCGNVLLDYWAMQSLGEPYDKEGRFAASGEVIEELLDAMLNDPYFAKKPPKSTGREYFNSTWLANFMPLFSSYKDADVQRTLLELTAKSIANEINHFDVAEVIVCGGGVQNSFLIQRLTQLCKADVVSSDHYGVSSEFMEAMVFAWFAYKRIHNEPVDLRTITGTRKNSLLGAIYG
ncbi:MAG: anhydro-N-acetylmuramic acid kinase [Helicobacteraceae bacterium]|nr:anhydro-N-acetylmuramic acid kinase [Helicobacteraceae bacterium]